MWVGTMEQIAATVQVAPDVCSCSIVKLELQARPPLSVQEFLLSFILPDSLVAWEYHVKAVDVGWDHGTDCGNRAGDTGCLQSAVHPSGNLNCRHGRCYLFKSSFLL